MWSRLEFACSHVALAVILQPCSGSSGSLPEAIWSWLELRRSHVEPVSAYLEPCAAVRAFL
jgi:hypothetical protein